MCLSFKWIFQSISCRNMMLSSCWPVQIYIYYCYAKQLDVLWQMFHVKYSSGYAYNWVHMWFLQFPKKIVLPYNMYVFSILPFMFLWFLTYINLLLSTFFHIIFYFMLYVCIFCTNRLQYIMLVHIYWCTVYVIYI